MFEEREGRWRGWMVAAQAGDAAAYEKLLLELLPHLRGFVRRRIRDFDSLEDVVQNVFVSLHRARHTYRPERPFGPWLHAVARNAVIDHVRARTRRSRAGCRRCRGRGRVRPRSACWPAWLWRRPEGSRQRWRARFQGANGPRAWALRLWSSVWASPWRPPPFR